MHLGDWVLELHCSWSPPLSMSNTWARSWVPDAVACNPTSGHPVWDTLQKLSITQSGTYLKSGHWPSLLDFFVQAPAARDTAIPVDFHTEWYANMLSHSKITFIMWVLNLIYCLAEENLWSPNNVCHILCIFINTFFFPEKGLETWLFFFSKESVIWKHLEPLVLRDVKKKRTVIYFLDPWNSFSKG